MCLFDFFGPQSRQIRREAANLLGTESYKPAYIREKDSPQKACFFAFFLLPNFSVMSTLQGKQVLILATDGFEESEFTEPKKALEAAGAKVHVVAPASGQIKAWAKTDWGRSYDVDVTLDEVEPEHYDAIVLPGGQINPDVLRTHEKALSLIRHFAEHGKPVAAICHAPWLLVETGLAHGRKLTGYTSILTDLRNAGAHVLDEAVVVDDNFITSRNPDDLPKFNQAIIDLLASPQSELSVSPLTGEKVKE